MATFEIYTRKDGEFSWRLKSGNGQTIASAGEGFKTKAGALGGIDAVKKDAADAKVVEVEEKA
jgi:uncharacterized protein YegP (UPF0339 family)